MINEQVLPMVLVMMVIVMMVMVMVWRVVSFSSPSTVSLSPCMVNYRLLFLLLPVPCVFRGTLRGCGRPFDLWQSRRMKLAAGKRKSM